MDESKGNATSSAEDDEDTPDDIAARGYTDADEELFQQAWAATPALCDWALLALDKVFKLYEAKLK